MGDTMNINGVKLSLPLFKSTDIILDITAFSIENGGASPGKEIRINHHREKERTKN
jgi:hypothetical protein